jgi:hypothetical protein
VVYGGTGSFTVDGTPDMTQATAKISGTWSSAETVEIPLVGWTTGSETYINIYTTDDARHTGKSGADCHRFHITNNYLNAYEIDVNYVRIHGQQIYVNPIQGAVSALSAENTNGYCEGAYNLILNVTTRHMTKGLNTGYSANTGGSVVYFNNIVINPGSWGYYNDNYDATRRVFVYNNTFISGIGGVNGAGNVDLNVKNNIVQNAIGSDYLGTFDSSASNLSSDASSPQTDLRNKTVVFVDSSAMDFHLSGPTNPAIGSGTDLSGEGFFTDDIDGDTRS